MEIRVAQPALRDAIQRRGRDDAAEGARRAEAAIVGHDEQHVGRALRRHDARRPPGFRLRGFFLDHPAELRIGRRQLVAAEGGGGAGRTGVPVISTAWEIGAANIATAASIPLRSLFILVLMNSTFVG